MSPSRDGGERPLEGRRILVTRAEDQGGDLVAALEALGAEVLWIPALRTVPVSPEGREAEIPDRLGTFAWAAFASPNAARYFLALLEERGRRLPPALKVAAVGSATALALKAAGLPVHCVPSEATGEALARHLVRECPPSRLLLPRGRKGREVLPELLGSAGWEVVPLTCYDTLPAAVAPEAAARLAGGVDAALFASPSAVRNLWENLPGPGREALCRALLFPIGPTTAAVLAALGLPHAAPPRDGSVPGLVGSLVEALGR